MCMCVCVCAYVYVRMCMCVCVCAYMYVRMCMCVYVCAYVYMCMCVCVCAYGRVCVSLKYEMKKLFFYTFYLFSCRHGVLYYRPIHHTLESKTGGLLSMHKHNKVFIFISPSQSFSFEHVIRDYTGDRIYKRKTLLWLSWSFLIFSLRKC